MVLLFLHFFLQCKDQTYDLCDLSAACIAVCESACLPGAYSRIKEPCTYTKASTYTLTTRRVYQMRCCQEVHCWCRVVNTCWHRKCVAHAAQSIEVLPGGTLLMQSDEVHYWCRVINDAEAQLAGQTSGHLEQQSSDGFQRLISPSEAGRSEAGRTESSLLLTSDTDAPTAAPVRQVHSSSYRPHRTLDHIEQL